MAKNKKQTSKNLASLAASIFLNPTKRDCIYHHAYTMCIIPHINTDRLDGD
jgi:hypothetical protein